MSNKIMEDYSSITLAEAYLRVKELDNLMQGLRSAVTRVSSSRVSAMVNKLSELLSESESLIRRVRHTEHSVVIGGTSIADIKLVINTLEGRIKFFSLITERTDLTVETLGVVKESIVKFQSTKDNLLRKYEEVIWEIGLLE
jgi:hypothetical protein